jgi:ATP-dependent exoDNAse (exonuclease V) alpha subunit
LKQEHALAFLKSGRNTFLTGSAGTGKTYVLNKYIQYLKERKIAVAITASTGIAATHMNGMTIHSWAGIGVKETLNSKQLRQLKSKKYLEKKMEKVRVLIIDEISMLHRRQLELVNEVLQYFKMNQLPFGGIQVVVSGDFFQLPPIGHSHESNKDKFAFMSPVWLQAGFVVCYLSEQYRQNQDALHELLNEIRSGRVSEYRYLQLKDASKIQLNTIEPTRLYTHNYDVDLINKEELAKLNTSSTYFTAELKGNEKLLDTLKKSVLSPERLELKIGARVMFVKNNPEKGIVNGSLGEVVDFDEENIPLVRLADGRIVSAEPEDWKIQDEAGTTLARFNQVPLRLAWAITIHKSQGMTIDAAEIDLSKTFEKGQGYVALSRLKSMKSLKLIGLNQLALQLDKLAFKADQRFQQLAFEAAQQYSISSLEKEAHSFIQQCGGITDEEEIKKRNKSIKNKEDKGKSSTYEVTYSYLKQHMPLDKIAEERGMTTGTIAGHLIKIKKDHPEANLSHYKPSKQTVSKVEKAYESLPREKGVSLKAIYENLGGKVSYMDIKLALAFIV